MSGTRRALGYSLALILLIGGPVLFFGAPSYFPINAAVAEANYSTRTETVVDKEGGGFRSSSRVLTFADGTTLRTDWSCQNGVDVGDRVTISTLAPYGATSGITTLGDCGAEALVSDVEGTFVSSYRDSTYAFVRLFGLLFIVPGAVLVVRIALSPEPTRTEIG